MSVNVNIYVQEKLQDGRYDRDEPRERILQELSAETLEVGGIGEDFSFFLEEKPGAFFWVGLGDDEHRCGAHQPGFDFNDKAIGGAASIFVKLVESRLAALSDGDRADGE